MDNVAFEIAAQPGVVRRRLLVPPGRHWVRFDADLARHRSPNGGLEVAFMTYDEFISDVVKVVEGVGAAIMVIGGLVALMSYLIAVARPPTRADAYQRLRRSLGEIILLGLEVLIVGDIVRTIVVDPTFESVTVLGLIVVIRIVLSFSLEVEIEGTWPWSRWKLAPGVARVDPEARSGP